MPAKLTLHPPDRPTRFVVVREGREPERRPCARLRPRPRGQPGLQAPRPPGLGRHGLDPRRPRQQERHVGGRDARGAPPAARRGVDQLRWDAGLLRARERRARWPPFAGPARAADHRDRAPPPALRGSRAVRPPAALPRSPRWASPRAARGFVLVADEEGRLHAEVSAGSSRGAAARGDVRGQRGRGGAGGLHRPQPRGRATPRATRSSERAPASSPWGSASWPACR